MRKICFYFCFLFVAISVFGNDTVRIRETQIPILIDRKDNVLFNLRVDSKQSKVLNHVTLRFGNDVKLSEIQSVKLYYSGTEAVQRDGQLNYAPVAYISREEVGKTREANRSYSVLKSEKKAPAQTVTLTCDQVLFPGGGHIAHSSASAFRRHHRHVVQAGGLFAAFVFSRHSWCFSLRKTFHPA